MPHYSTCPSFVHRPAHAGGTLSRAVGVVFDGNGYSGTAAAGGAVYATRGCLSALVSCTFLGNGGGVALTAGGAVFYLSPQCK